MKNYVIAVAAFVSALALVGCSEQPAPQVYQQPQQVVQPVAVAPTVVQQPIYAQPAPVYAAPQAPVVVHDNSGANMATGMMLGAMMANAGNSGGSNRTTVVNRTTVIRQAPPTRVYVQPAPVRQTYTAPAPRTVAPAAANRFSRSTTTTTSSSSSSGFRRR